MRYPYGTNVARAERCSLRAPKRAGIVNHHGGFNVTTWRESMMAELLLTSCSGPRGKPCYQKSCVCMLSVGVPVYADALP